MLNHAERINVREVPADPMLKGWTRYRATLGFFYDQAITDEKKNDTPKAVEETENDVKTKLLHMVYGPIIHRLKAVAVATNDPQSSKELQEIITELQVVK